MRWENRLDSSEDAEPRLEKCRKSRPETCIWKQEVNEIKSFECWNQFSAQWRERFVQFKVRGLVRQNFWRHVYKEDTGTRKWSCVSLLGQNQRELSRAAWYFSPWRAFLLCRPDLLTRSCFLQYPSCPWLGYKKGTCLAFRCRCGQFASLLCRMPGKRYILCIYESAGCTRICGSSPLGNHTRRGFSFSSARWMFDQNHQRKTTGRLVANTWPSMHLNWNFLSEAWLGNLILHPLMLFMITWLLIIGT